VERSCYTLDRMCLEPIVVVGMGAVSALGIGVERLWSGLLGGARPFRPVAGFDAAHCRVNIAAEVARPFAKHGSCRSVDFGVVAAREALDAARCDARRDRMGVVMGSTAMGDAALETAFEASSPDPQMCAASNKGWLAHEFCQALAIQGPRQVINTACSSGANAIVLACQGLQAGDYDTALAVGCDEISRFTYSGFQSLRALDANPCRPFDVQRRGMTLGEGAGCLVLERLTDARRRGRHILGYVAGYGCACDAHHLTAPDPEGIGAAIAIERALAMAEINAHQVGFVNAHGTGTPLNDAAEVTGIERALGPEACRCPVHSVKASTGHCLGAAGALEAIVTILSLRAKLVPATAGLVNSEFDGRVDCVRGEPRPIDTRFAVTNSFGFGGNNAALVLAVPEVLP
jgi:3-oxoacyl-[acyl-carrier-protein] synthase II